MNSIVSRKIRWITLIIVYGFTGVLLKINGPEMLPWFVSALAIVAIGGLWMTRQYERQPPEDEETTPP